MADRNIDENSPATFERQHNTWLDQAFSDFQKNGGLEGNPYKGKPIPIQSDRGEGAALNSILKNANVLPPWLELQHEIRDQIKRLLDLMATLPDDHIDSELTKINDKVKKFNNMCPPPLQKVRIFKDLIEKQYEKWC
jgi:hypothetical protein